MDNTSSEPDWREIVDALPDAAIIIDRAGIVLHANAMVADVFPRARTDQPVTLISREPALLRAISEMPREAARKVVRLRDRVPVDRQLTAIISVLDGVADDRGVPALLILFRDVAEQERHQRLRADFIANASHELRTPLASLKLLIETMQGAGRNDPGARDNFLARMSAQAERMTQLINDLMSLNRVEMRAHLTPRDRINVVELLSSVSANIDAMAEAAEISLTTPVANEPIYVLGDYDELSQVFLNLIQNAIRYGRQGGTISLAIERLQAPLGEQIAISVNDDGIGIAPEHLPRLTERFYRVSATASRDKGGTGLGLAIVKHIVTRHRGELHISSTPEKGSTFTVLLAADSEN